MSCRPQIALTIVLAAGCAETERPASMGTGLEERLSRLVRTADITGLSIAVVRTGQPAWGAVYGVRDARSGEPVARDTLFEAASLSKPIFAYAVMRLVERGELDLDKPLAEYLPYARLEHDERYKKITARLVLSHSSGLPNWGGTPLEMAFDPGERFGYSGEGYLYLQKVVESVTGLSLNGLATREVFEPLGMTESGYEWVEVNESRMAEGHDFLGEPRTKRRREGGGGNAAASLITTADDYARFLRAVLESRGLAPESWRQVLAPRVPVVDSETKDTAENLFWGLGFGVQTGDAGPAFFHWGDNPGYKAYSIGYVDRGVALVYFTNSDDGLSVAAAILDEIVEDSHDAIAWLDYDTHDAHERLTRRSLARAFLDGGPEAGITFYRQTSSRNPDLDYETLLNDVGYALLRQEEVDTAIEVFELNVEEHPESSNVQVSLAEAHTVAGRDEAAIAAYERALELDPDNHDAQRNLRWIRAGMEARAAAVRLPGKALVRYEGNYGPCRVRFSNDALYARIDWLRNDYRLVPLAEDSFALEGQGTYRLQFVSDEIGRVVRLVGHRPTGPIFDASKE